MSRLHRTLLLAGGAAIAVAAVAGAQAPGTMFGIIVDENEEPVPGVVIVITDPERPELREEFESDKRGRYKIRLTNVNVPYDISLSKEGYVTVNLAGVKIPAKRDERRNLTMQSIEAARASGEVEVDVEEAAKGSAIKIYNEGVQALDLGDVAAAKNLFVEALEKKDDLGVAMAALARAHLELEEHAAAAAWAEKAIAAETEADAMTQILYAAYSAMGEEEKAQQALSKLKEADPEKASLNMFNEAADLFNAGNLAEAQTAFSRILETNPDHAKSHYMLGLCYVNSGDNAKAKEHFSRFLELAPDDPDAGTAAEMVQYLE